MSSTRRGGESRIQRDYQPVQPTFAQSTSVPGSRVRKPALDEMGSARNRPIPARDGHEAPSARPGAAASSAPAEPAGGVGRRIAGVSDIDPRTKAGAYGEKIRGPHKPTLDEMGPHAERGLPVAGKPDRRGSDPSQSRSEATRNVGGEGSDPSRHDPDKRTRRGRPRKTGRPGR